MGIVRSESTTIDGITYTTRTLPATVGLDVSPRLVTLLGDKLMPLIFEVGNDGLEELFQNPAVIGQIITNIAERITKRQAEGENPTAVLRDMMKTTEADKIRLGDTTVKGSVYEHFDDHFAGDYGHLIRVVRWVGGVNFMPASTENP